MTASQAAWGGFLDSVRGCESRLLAVAPDAATSVEALGYLGRLSASVLGQFLQPEERTIGGIYYPAARIGGQNPDYRMGITRLDPAGHYRLSGRFNDAARIGFGLYTPKPQAGLDLDDYVAAKADAKGAFSVEIGGGPGSMKMQPTTAVLMVRELQLRPGGARAGITLERLDQPPPVPSAAPPSDAVMAATLQAAGGQLDALVDQFINWSVVIARSPNVVIRMPDELDLTVRGDADTRYYTGHFDLTPDQALEIDIPQNDAGYWMIQAMTQWLEQIPGANCNMATIDPASRTVILSTRDPGRPNWFNIGGRRHGHIIYRAVGATVSPVPAARIITLQG